MPISELTRPIVGMENRTPQEVFDIMADRIRRSLSASPSDAERHERPDPLKDAVEWCLDRDNRNGSLPEAYAEKLRSALSISQSDPAPEIAEDAHACPVCLVQFVASDICATDIELGTCHAACLEGSPTVNLDTGEPIDGPIPTFPYSEDLVAEIAELKLRCEANEVLAVANGERAKEEHQRAESLEAEIAELRAENERSWGTLPDELTGKLQWAMHDAFAYSKADTIAGRMIDVYAALRAAVAPEQEGAK